MKELIYRPRRLRRTAALREMVRETRLEPSNLIYPLFACPGEGVRREVKSMPGVFNLSVDELVKECEDARRAGVSSIIVFGLPERKDERGGDAFAEDGITQRAIRAVKREVKDLLVVADTCLCEYTSHGHCGVIEDGDVANDPTLKILAQTAISQAESGADIIAPSGMMDGMVAAIRAGLDAAGFTHIPILSYAVKYASAFYGPFREAADSAPQFGDRRGYQMDPPNVREALREAALDVEQGADIIAPSGMMDGMVAAIRAGLDATGFTHIPILSYAVKYASAFYGPFREAADSAPQFGDRRGYQMDPPNVREALREAALDVEQGADMLMVKPALPYLDVLRAARERFDLPLAAYQVSGEYAQIKAAGRLGWIDEERVMMESLIGIKRAGADLILTYFAKDVIKRL